MSSIKVSDLFKESENWYNFYAHFYNYKLCNELPAIFGRDAELDLDDLHHIHIAGSAKIQAIWSRKSDQFYRTTPLNEPENDLWLIYAYDEFRHEYLLLTVLTPGAHDRDRWGSYLRDIAVQIVEPWVQGKLVYSDPDEEDEEGQEDK